jgi:hypothetical protein
MAAGPGRDVDDAAVLLLAHRACNTRRR